MGIVRIFQHILYIPTFLFCAQMEEVIQLHVEMFMLYWQIAAMLANWHNIVYVDPTNFKIQLANSDCQKLPKH